MGFAPLAIPGPGKTLSSLPSPVTPGFQNSYSCILDRIGTLLWFDPMPLQLAARAKDRVPLWAKTAGA